MTDQEKVIKLLNELGIKHEVDGNTIFIDSFECDGAEEFGISFWDGEYYPKGSYHEFWVVPVVSNPNNRLTGTSEADMRGGAE